MFQKLVANLSFSPSLVGELGFYAKQLKREEIIRLYGLLGALALLLLQLVIAAHPTESANTTHANDLLYGGFHDKKELLEKYDRNEQNFQDILSSFSINRSAIVSTNPGTIVSNTTLSTAGRLSVFSYSSSEQPHAYTKKSGGSGSIYLTPLSLHDAGHTPMRYAALIGNTSTSERFAIIQSSGNLVVKTSSIENSSRCQDTSCDPRLEYRSSVINTTQGRAADTTHARPSDRITYRLYTKNISNEDVTTTPTGQFKDTLEYADIIDTDGGTLDASSGTISWPASTLAANQAVIKSVSMRMQPHLAATARGLSNPTSYDCALSSGYGNIVRVYVACPVPKYIEATASSLPHTPSTLPLAANGVLVLVTGFFYLRARQQREEIRLIRKDINTSTF
ncbi:hypothetical protein I8H83_04695 [Candidatus Saccharibacteria bacterium]|nr:hypothetical protein [Candidatus Saccharibacteria bacterium]